MVSWLRSIVGLVVLATVVVFGGGGFHYSSQVLEPGEVAPPARDMVVTGIDEDSISIRVTDEAPDHAVRDLRGDLDVGFTTYRGYLRLVGEPLQLDAGAATRAYEVVAGGRPAAGDLGGADTRAFPDDPAVLGLPFTDVTVDTDLGTFAGWEFRGSADPDHWVVFTHGRGGTRGDALRMVQHVVGELGLSALVVTHRNDPGMPASPDGHGHYGATEWQDLQSWLGWLQRTRVPSEVTLFGLSQGASVAAFCLERCEATGNVSGAILDSPLLSLPETLELQARDRGIPDLLRDPLLSVTDVIVGLRGGTDVDDVDHVVPLAELDLPILAFHGTQDRSVPISPTRALATRDPDQVTLVEYEGDHVRGWNVDQATYEAALTAFLAG